MGLFQTEQPCLTHVVSLNSRALTATIAVLADISIAPRAGVSSAPGVQGSGCQRKSNDVVAGAPEQVLNHLAIPGTRKPHNGHDIQRIGSEPGLRPRFRPPRRNRRHWRCPHPPAPGPGIVHAVASDRHQRATRVDFLDFGGFVLGQDFGEVFIQPDLRRARVARDTRVGVPERFVVTPEATDYCRLDGAGFPSSGGTTRRHPPDAQRRRDPRARAA